MMVDAMDIPANPEVDLSQVPKLGSLDFTGVSPAYRTLRLVQWGLVQTVLALGILSPMILRAVSPDMELPDDLGAGILWVPLLVQLVLGGFWLLEEALGFPRRGYVVRDRDITYRTGWFSRSTTTVPYGQIQHLELTQGPAARLFGLKHLKLYTAGGSGNLRIAGLDEEDAERLRAVLDTRTGKG